MSNRLAAEKSPYLLQHAGNPVEWYPWGEEAFVRSRTEDKPIFLSVGYATCHWCHVMERESFENAEVAAVLNSEFVSIKVDREERPDVDRVYMTFVQVTTGAGGWPMSVWLTPDLQPFYGGTYFPPTARWQRPGFIDVLLEIARVWRADRPRVLQSAAQLVERLRSAPGSTEGTSAVPGADALGRTVAQFRTAYDGRRGGFGDAPKFPRPSELLFLFREHARTGSTDAREMALHALRAMALGGMRDHIGGGFHRYSVDAEWRVPHFEKMLYDQAQLALAYLEAAQITGDRFYAAVARDTLAYVQREMTDPAGGFYSAEDADSIPSEHVGALAAHKVEGAFYVWTADEIAALGDDAAITAARYGVKPDGNAPSDPQGEFVGKNLLYVARSLDEVATLTSSTPADVEQALARARVRLYQTRLARPRPQRDDKVLTAWNGLMIAAFARAARVLRHSALGGSTEDATELVNLARGAAGFITRVMWDSERQVLRRRYRDGDVAIDGYAEDYACATFGLLELFQADGDPSWFVWARTLQQRLDALFWDPVDGGWFSTTGQDPSVLVRLKDDYDGAEPSASSIAVVNAIVLAHLYEDADLNQRIARTLSLFGVRLSDYGRVVPMMSAALSMREAGVGQIVVVHAEDGRDSSELLDALAARYLPFAVTIPVSAGHMRALAEVLPPLAAMPPVDGRATAYVCRDYVCLAPATSAESLVAQLGGTNR
jgi:uncharacterized protein YyaL (SSP411 family)